MIENKEILTLEFRYFDKWKVDEPYETKTICLGIFDNFEDAISLGNKVLEEIFEKHFPLVHTVFPRKERFGKNNNFYNSSTRLVRGLNYLRCPFDFYLKIETLEFSDVEQTVLEVKKASMP